MAGTHPQVIIGGWQPPVVAIDHQKVNHQWRKATVRMGGDDPWGWYVSESFPPPSLSAVPAPVLRSRAGVALDAADGVLDGRYYGRPIVETRTCVGCQSLGVLLWVNGQN